MKYRKDIDGLRALAVIPVLLFHAGAAGFSGGFVGVDVFFVISGFLITSIILRDLKTDTFSMVTFWERRLRRIVPALTVVVLATMGVGYLLVLFPLDYMDIGQSALAQAVFLSNLFFLRKNDYFSEPAEGLPLLHTWSLSIEEQFYLIFPVLLLFLYRWLRSVLLSLLVGLTVLSLAISAYLGYVAPTAGFSVPLLPALWGGATNASAAFYLLPARAFELLIGVLLAAGTWQCVSARWANGLAVLGLGMVIFAVVTFDSETVFPGVAALVPTIGTALILFSGGVHQTIVSRLLSFPAFVWIGLISYSLYLWHWPIIVFAKQYTGMTELSAGMLAAVLGLSFLLAWISYRFVETPFRVKRLCRSQQAMFLSGIGMIVLVAGLGWYIAAQNGFSGRVSGAAQSVAAAATDFDVDRKRCFVNAFVANDEPCVLGADVEPTHLVLGDSHGGALLSSLKRQASQSGVSFSTYLFPGCSPFSDITARATKERCAEVNALALEEIASGAVEEVLLVARWSSFKELSESEAEAEELFQSAAVATVATLKEAGVRTTILLQVPHHTYFDTRTVFYAAVDGEDLGQVTLPRSIHNEQSAFVRGVMSELQQSKNVELLDPAEILCDTERCYMGEGTVFWYQDSNHLNKTGADQLDSLLRRFFQTN